MTNTVKNKTSKILTSKLEKTKISEELRDNII